MVESNTSKEDLIDKIYKNRDSFKPVNLDKIKRLLKLLNNPQDKTKFVHITGTNGKGSITTMLSNVLLNAGYKTGKFISPFVDNFFERIQINNEYIKDFEMEQLVDKILTTSEKENIYPNGLEIIVIAAFMYFAENNCDIVCLEVGVGGRLDPTNVITNTLISLISIIDFDHTKLLGNTLEEIAYEKSGIIKKNSYVITYPLQKKEPLDIIKKRSNAENSTFVEFNMETLINVKKEKYNYSFSYNNKNYILGLNGKYQIYNSLMVIEACRVLKKLEFKISYYNVFNALKDTKFIGRMDIVNTNPDVIIDGAHNELGARALKEFIIENEKVGKVILIAGMKEEKNAKEYFGILGKLCKTVIITDIKDKYIRGTNINELYNTVKEFNQNVYIVTSNKEAYDRALKLCSEDKENIVIITGSLYLISKFYEII